jgi:hypothetical protein
MSEQTHEILAPAGAKILVLTCDGYTPGLGDAMRELQLRLLQAAKDDAWPQIVALDKSISVRWLEVE